MKTIESLINKHKEQKALIIGAGSTVREYQPHIKRFIKNEMPLIIGINNITDFFIPDYHLWTNTQRFRTYGNKINKKSKILLGAGIHLKTVRETIGSKEYTLINFTDMKEGVPIGYKKGKIYGLYRTAGCLAIMVLHLMGVKEINIVGMDGYSYHTQEELTSGKESHHCYGKGFTDTATWKTCVKKDNIIEKVLHNLRNYGINFNIITPTKYEEFYDDNIRLHV